MATKLSSRPATNQIINIEMHWKLATQSSQQFSLSPVSFGNRIHPKAKGAAKAMPLTEC
jgi:hypothetical protein